MIFFDHVIDEFNIIIRSNTSEELRPPLVTNNPLILASDAVITQQATNITGESNSRLIQIWPLSFINQKQYKSSDVEQ